MTGTPTPTIDGAGPIITYFGIARADGIVTQPIGVNPQGIPIFERPVAQGFFVVVEARRGPELRPVGTSTFNWSPNDPNVLPDFMIVSSRALGNGSAAVCDDGTTGPPGGVPAVSPPAFGGTQAVANAINDFSCRFDARSVQGDACTRDESAQSRFVVQNSVVQFCPRVGIGAELAFPAGDTMLTTRVRNNLGQLGAPASIIIRRL